MTGGEPVVRRIGAAGRGLKRDTLLDAATALLADASWREISMEKVALRAGASRQTVYNEFGSRAGFESAYVTREVGRFLDRFEHVAADFAGDATDVLEAGTLALLTATRSNAMVLAITRGGADELLSLFTTRGRPVVAMATERLGGFFAREWPWLGEPDAATLAETLVRLAISHGALAMNNDANTAQSIARVAGPFVDAKRLQADGSAESQRSTG